MRLWSWNVTPEKWDGLALTALIVLCLVVLWLGLR